MDAKCTDLKYQYMDIFAKELVLVLGRYYSIMCTHNWICDRIKLMAEKWNATKMQNIVSAQDPKLEGGVEV